MTDTCPLCSSAVSPSTPPAPISSEAEALLGTNNPPSEHARHTFGVNLVDSETRLEDVTGRIARLEESLRILREEQSELNRAVQTYRKVLHPIRLLPQEVLYGIFSACIEPSGIMDTFLVQGRPYQKDSLDPAKPPWTLAQVSRAWRTAAISYPSLWSYIGIQLPNSSTSEWHINRMAAQLMLQLQRSQLHSLTVSLRSEYNENHPRVDRLLLLICSHSARWDTLRTWFWTTPIETFEAMSWMIKGNLPVLRRLYLEIGHHSQTGGTIDVFEFAPQLQDLMIWGRTAGLSDVLRLPWTQITRFRGTSDKSEARTSIDYDFLSKMMNLRELVEIRHFPPTIVESETTLQLRSLQSLAIVAKEGSVLPSKVLDIITSDNLLDFRLDARTDPVSVARLLTRSSATIRSLSLRLLGDINAAHVIRVLECVPRLTSLSLRQVSDEVIMALGEQSASGKPRLLKDLEKLTLYAPCRIDGNILFAMAMARAREPMTLCLDDNVTLQDDTRQELEGLRRQGLNFCRIKPKWSQALLEPY
ncbi:hypothetical protein VNI00_004771 [Paramarasmius palmivorus]|uniref:F-box domain-containing protein n=1 Tax=Paramarasmius palmivorus TaxID=297713 RepID=A0AAW0DIW9_9AGAR